MEKELKKFSEAKPVPSADHTQTPICNHLPGNTFRKGQPLVTAPLGTHLCFPNSPRLIENHRTSKPTIRRGFVTSPGCGAENGSI